MRQLILLPFLLLFHSGFSAIVKPDSASLSIKDSLMLQDLVSAAELDSAIHCYYEDLILFSHDIYSPSDLHLSDTIPVYTSEVYKQRLALLDSKTPFDLSYNTTIEAFIHLYVSKKRELSAKCLGRSDLYFPMFEETLDKYNLPLELKYLAVVESALDPKIKSRAGATGLWQFMFGTGKAFGLTVNSYVDERCDPIKSTDAACRYLSHLYKMFGDWNLALAAYNCGEGRVMKAIRRSGGQMNYWSIYPYLPSETRGYVPAFIAVNYLFAHAADHKISPIAIPYNSIQVDSIHVSNPVDFAKLGAILNLDVQTISQLNPVYKLNYVPAYENFNVVYLPKEKINLWVSNESTISDRLANSNKTVVTAEAAPEVSKAPASVPAKLTYTVRSGDYLGKIASRYNCSVSELQKWNRLSGTTLKVGQTLVIYGAQQHTSANSPASPQSTYYTVRSGDSLWSISKNKGITVDELKRLNNNVSSIHPGQKLIVSKG